MPKGCEALCAVGTYPHRAPFHWLWAVDPVLGEADLECYFQAHILVFHPAHPFWLPCSTTFSPICGWQCFSGTAFAGMRTSSASGWGQVQESAGNRREGILRSVPRRKCNPSWSCWPCQTSWASCWHLCGVKVSSFLLALVT